MRKTEKVVFYSRKCLHVKVNLFKPLSLSCDVPPRGARFPPR